FFIGILPAFVAIWIQQRTDESPEWTRTRGARHAGLGSLRAIFAPAYLKYTLLLTALSATTIFAYWGLNLWIPAYLSLPTAQGGIGLTTTVTTLLVVIIQIGTFFGYVSFGFVADAIGRKRSFVTYILTAAVLVLGFGQTRNVWALAVLGPVATFFGTGLFSVFGAVS